MKKIIGYIRLYFNEVNKPVLLSTSLFTAVLIFLNYYFNIDKWIAVQHFPERFLLRWSVSLVAFAVPYSLLANTGNKKYFSNKLFVFLLVAGPAIFALKMALIVHFNLSANDNSNHYWNQILYWPFRLLVITLLLYILWKRFYTNQSFFGLTVKNFNWKPYAGMLFIMIPLIAAASTQPDFLHIYPKLKMINHDIVNIRQSWLYKLFFELSYGSDFISIEVFFRGFLVLGFIKWAGKDAILPMACFYCTIHFGKPLGECISSYFGGLLLGIVVYHTRSIFGGLIVHLGIAWLMELGGYTGNIFLNK